jgi:hypothetical protein
VFLIAQEVIEVDAMDFIYNEGGRAAAGYKGRAGDCVVRAIAIATQKPYQEVYDAINALALAERARRGRRSSARSGVGRTTYERYLRDLGWEWVATMQLGSGCRVHLRRDELPKGRLVVRLSRHLTAVIDGVIHDIYNPDRGGTRCVYGYFKLAQSHREAEK